MCSVVVGLKKYDDKMKACASIGAKAMFNSEHVSILWATGALARSLQRASQSDQDCRQTAAMDYWLSPYL